MGTYVGMRSMGMLICLLWGATKVRSDFEVITSSELEFT